VKKNGILNRDLSRVIACLGHTDQLVICDSGLPIPREKEVVDLALTANMPRFVDTLEVVLQELQVEKAIIAEELEPLGNGVYDRLTELLDGVPIEAVPHERFKELTRGDGTCAIVRTGEATPYANVILVSGVTFG
jgi:D-ribose pyranase